MKGGHRLTLSLPEMRQVVKHGLLVELVFVGVEKDWAVHIDGNPTGSPLHIQGDIPGNPPCDKVVEGL